MSIFNLPHLRNAQAAQANAHRDAARRHLMQRIVDQQDAIDVSWTYRDRGKTFKCGPWRWHVYAKQGTHLRTVFKRKEEQ